MVDLEIIEDGKVKLNRDILKGAIITYQNIYLKGINQIAKVEVLEDIKMIDVLFAGHYKTGKVVICANENTDDYLIIKKQI